MLFIWQGLDFADEGFCLTNYQQIFNDPESVSYGIGSWLTNIIGGLWILLFGDSLGVIGARFAGVLVVYLTIVFSYLLLKPYIGRKYLLIGLLFASLFTKWYYLLFYNSLTSLFFVASAFFLINGLKNNKHWQIIVSGLLLGLNIFIRFPNILGFSLVLSIFFYGYINKNKIRVQIIQTISFIFGYTIAILVTVLIMKVLGHYDLFVNGMKWIFTVSKETTGHHNLKGLMTIYYMEYLKVIGFTAIAIPLVIIMPKVFMKLKNQYLYKGSIIFLITFASLLFMLALLRYYDIMRFLIVLIVGILYVILLAYIIKIEKSSSDFRLVCFITLLILFITPMGSTVGLRNAIYGMWIPIPIASTYILRLKKLGMQFETATDSSMNQFKFRLNQKEVDLTKKIVIISLIVFSLLSSFIYTYRDSSNRFQMRYSVDNPRLRGILMTKERAKAIQELLDEMGRYVKENDYLLAYQEISMVYFLTRTKPYLYNSQPFLYRTYEFKNALDRATKERIYLPVIVREKINIWDFNWPKGSIPFTRDDRKAENSGIMEEFIERNGYLLVWENDSFEILIPPSEINGKK